MVTEKGRCAHCLRRLYREIQDNCRLRCHRIWSKYLPRTARFFAAVYFARAEILGLAAYSVLSCMLLLMTAFPPTALSHFLQRILATRMNSGLQESHSSRTINTTIQQLECRTICYKVLPFSRKHHAFVEYCSFSANMTSPKITFKIKVAEYLPAVQMAIWRYRSSKFGDILFFWSREEKKKLPVRLGGAVRWRSTIFSPFRHPLSGKVRFNSYKHMYS